MIFACDVNLGFPDDDPVWVAFFLVIMAGASPTMTTWAN